MTHAEAQIDVVECDLEALVEAADCFEYIPSDHHASSGDARQVLIEFGTAEIPSVTTRQMAMGMIGHSTGSEDNPSMLDRAVGITHDRAYGTYSIEGYSRDKSFQPIGGLDAYVVIHEAQDRARRLGRSPIVYPCEIERPIGIGEQTKRPCNTKRIEEFMPFPDCVMFLIQRQQHFIIWIRSLMKYGR